MRIVHGDSDWSSHPVLVVPANLTGRLRLSADLRFQPLAAPIAQWNGDERAVPHYHPDVPDWPTLTRSWTSKRSVTLPQGVTFVAALDPMVEHMETSRSRFSHSH